MGSPARLNTPTPPQVLAAAHEALHALRHDADLAHMSGCTYLTCLSEFLMRGAVHVAQLPPHAHLLLTELLQRGYQDGYLVSGLADEIKRLVHPDGEALNDTRVYFCEECVRIIAEAMVPLRFRAKASALLFLHEFGRNTGFAKRA